MGLKQGLKRIVINNSILKKAYDWYLQNKRKQLVKKNYKEQVLVKREKENENLPLSDVFRNTYNSKKWGGEDVSFYSGPGSYGEITGPYVKMVTEFIQKNNIGSVVDLGCGDFNIGRQITSKLPHIKYTGVDIFQEIIDHNNKNYGSENIRFLCIDTTKNQVPGGDLLLIREVLQHLSNQNIQKILNIQFPLFRYKIITEHHPDKNLLITHNLDKPDGFGVRVDHGSGVYLDHPPFNRKWKELLSYKVDFGVVKSFEVID